MVGTPWLSRVTLTGAERPRTASVPSSSGSAERAILKNHASAAAVITARATQKPPSARQVRNCERESVIEDEGVETMRSLDCRWRDAEGQTCLNWGIANLGHSGIGS